jgi:uncharacterized protein YhbP (UPF0306 family)
MSKLSSVHENALVYLREHNVVTVAMHGPEGLRSAAVFYVNDGFTLYFLFAPGSRYSLSIAQETRVAATIHEDCGEWRAIKGIRPEGHASRIEGPQQARAALLYGKKFPHVADLARAPTEIARAFSRIAWYRVAPTRLHLVDNSQEFWHRDEIAM